MITEGKKTWYSTENTFTHKIFASKYYSEYLCFFECERRPLTWNHSTETWVEALAKKGPKYLMEGTKRTAWREPREIAFAVARFAFSILLLQPFIAPLGFAFTLSKAAYFQLQHLKASYEKNTTKQTEIAHQFKALNPSIAIDGIAGFMGFGYLLVSVIGYLSGAPRVAFLNSYARVLVLEAIMALGHALAMEKFLLPSSALRERIVLRQKYGIVGDDGELLPLIESSTTTPLIEAYTRKLDQRFNELNNLIPESMKTNDPESMAHYLQSLPPNTKKAIILRLSQDLSKEEQENIRARSESTNPLDSLLLEVIPKWLNAYISQYQNLQEERRCLEKFKQEVKISQIEERNLAMRSQITHFENILSGLQKTLN